VDVDGAIPSEVTTEISSIKGVLSVRSLSNGSK
jgi:hypothetical protein